jgi:anti-anti-sigma factor
MDAADSPVGLTVTRRDDADSVAVLDAAGYIDLSNAELLARAIADALRAAGTVVVDLSGVSFMDSSGLRELVVGRHQAEAAGRGYRVTGAGGHVLQVLEISGTLEYLAAGVSRT